MKRRDFFKGMAGATALVVLPKALAENLLEHTVDMDLASPETESKSVISKIDNQDFPVPQTTGKGFLNFRMYDDARDPNKMIAEGCISSLERPYLAKVSIPDPPGWVSYRSCSDRFILKGIIDLIYYNEVELVSYHFIGSDHDFMYEWDGYITSKVIEFPKEKSEFEIVIIPKGAITCSKIE